MEIAISIILFIVAAFVVISVFCFISWLFHRKHGDYVPPLEEQLDAAKGENDPYLQNQKRNNAPKEIQMQNFQPTPFKLNFSKMSQTDNMLSNRILNSFPNTSRTKNQTSFRNPFQNQLTPSNYNDDEKKNVKHNYISKLANYTSKGIELYEKQLMSIKNVKIFKDLNWVEEIKENFTVRKQLYNAQIDNFEDILDIIKLQLGQYGAIKFVTQIQIRSCQYDKQYNVDLLIKNQRFELISVEEYEEEKYKLQAI